MQKNRREKIKPSIHRELWVRAGGRCEFPNCNEYLLTEPITQSPGNYGELAHNKPHGKSGPRFKERLIGDNVDSIENLLLLCLKCHKLIDTNEGDYPVSLLQKFKKDHETRIFELTSISPDKKSTVIRLTGNINGDTTVISEKEARITIFQEEKRYPEFIARGTSDHEIDLRSLPNIAYWENGRQEIDKFIESTFSRFHKSNPVQHLSIFSFAKIPFIFYLGFKLGDKIPIDIYQRNRHSQNWLWSAADEDIKFGHSIHKGKQDEISLILSVSGNISDSMLPERIINSTKYHIRPAETSSSRSLLLSKNHLFNFRKYFDELLREIEQQHGSQLTFHLFPALPVSLSFIIGQQLLKSMNHKIHLYDLNNGKFDYVMEVINDNK